MTARSDETSPGHQAQAHGAALMVVLLLTMGVGPLVNYAVTATSDHLIQQLGITAGLFGLLVTCLFVSAALASMVLGRLADVLSVRDQMIFNFGGTALAIAVASVGPSYVTLLVAMILVGPAQVIANPTTNRVILHVVPELKRPNWIGVKQSGVQASQLVTGLMFPPGVLLLGWTWTCICASLLVVGLLLWSLRHVPAEEPTDWSALRRRLTGRAHRPASPRRGVLPGGVWILTAVAFFSGAGVQATNAYVALFAVRDFGYTMIIGGLAVGLAGVIGVLSRIAWGRALSRGSTPARMLTLIGVGASAGALSLTAAAVAGLPALFWLGVCLHGASALGTNVVVNAGVMQSVDRHLIGTATGATTMGMYAGFAAGPVGMGALIELSGGFEVGWSVVAGFYAALLVTVFFLRSRA